MIGIVNPYRFGKKVLAVYDPIGIEASAAVETGWEWAPMDSGHAILVYAKSGTYYAVCITLSGTTPSRGTAVSIGTGIAHYSVTRMDATHAIFTYRDTSNNYGKAVCLTLDPDADTISVGSAYTFSTNNCRTTAVLGMDSGHAICCFKDSTDGSKPKALVLTLSGTTVNGGTILTIESNDIGSFNHGANSWMDATRAIFKYNPDSEDMYVVGLELDAGTDTLTNGTPALVIDASDPYTFPNTVTAGIDSTNAIAVSRLDAAITADKLGRACGLVLDPDTLAITVGTQMTWNNEYTQALDLCHLGSGVVIVSFLDSTFDGIDLFHSASGPTITAPNAKKADIAPTGIAALAKWYGSSTHMLLAYQDTGDSNYGKIRCMTYL